MAALAGAVLVAVVTRPAFNATAAAGATPLAQPPLSLRGTGDPGGGAALQSGSVPGWLDNPPDGAPASIALGAALASSVPRGFPDVPPGFWAYNSIESLAARGIVSGRPDGTFGPEATVTRAQFVKMLDLTVGLQPSSTVTPFSDVPVSAWFAPYVAAALGAGIVAGVSPTSFAPDQGLTREQLAVLMARALDLTKLVPLSFTDRGQIDLWALVAVEEAVGAGYLQGFPNGSFQPRHTATRAQAATVLASVLRQRAARAETQA